MSVFYHNDDPLLRQPPISFLQNNVQNPNNVNDTYAQMYKQQLMMEMQQQQQQPMVPKDWLSELDSMMKGLDGESSAILNSDEEFITLNTSLQGLIQNELMLLVKYKINANDSAIDNIKKQIKKKKKVSNQVKEKEKQNFNDLNDYLQNYSHLTFDEYRKLKNGVTVSENKPTKTKKDK